MGPTHVNIKNPPEVLRRNGGGSELPALLLEDVLDPAGAARAVIVRSEAARLLMEKGNFLKMRYLQDIATQQPVFARAIFPLGFCDYRRKMMHLRLVDLKDHSLAVIVAQHEVEFPRAASYVVPFCFGSHTASPFGS